jgi:hypothetical protein
VHHADTGSQSVTMVTVVTVFSVARSVSKSSSPSTRPSRERRKSQWGIPAGGDCRKTIQPEPIDFCSRKTLDSGGMAAPFLLPNGECARFRLAVRPPFSKGDEHWGAVRRQRGKAPFPLGERKEHLLMAVGCQKCFCVTFDKSNKTPAVAGTEWKGWD